MFGEKGTAADCVLEYWRTMGREEGIAARDNLRVGVEAALLEFGRVPSISMSRTSLIVGRFWVTAKVMFVDTGQGQFEPRR